ncbi:MAG: hypothetical protein H6658_03525 [Ardenticatenaceae bacterium]|nr:hypothetical protein [Ardenticatenaceae bacterium]
MEILIDIHGLIRWLVAVVALVAIVKFAMGWLQKMAYEKMDRGLMSGYTGLLDLNFLLGLIILLFGGGFNGARIEHATTMFIAIAIAHASAAWRKSEDAQKKFRNNLIVVVVSLLFIIMGVIRLRGGWLF